MISRRGFLGVLAAPVLARFAPVPVYDWKTLTSTLVMTDQGPVWVGDITPATFTFWRNQQAYGDGSLPHLEAAYDGMLNRDLRQLFAERG